MHREEGLHVAFLTSPTLGNIEAQKYLSCFVTCLWICSRLIKRSAETLSCAAIVEQMSFDACSPTFLDCGNLDFTSVCASISWIFRCPDHS